MNIILVDDDNLIRNSLSIILKKEPDIRIVGSTDDGYEALKMCDNNPVDIILMDIQMPKLDGIKAVRMIKEKHPDILIMMLTTFADQEHIKEALKSGASGYILKTDPLTDLVPRLRMLKAETAVISMDALKELNKNENERLKTLTPREFDIVRLVAKGLSNKAIAKELYLSEGTVRNNLVVIMEKMNVDNRTQLSFCYRE